MLQDLELHCEKVQKVTVLVGRFHEWSQACVRSQSTQRCVSSTASHSHSPTRTSIHFDCPNSSRIQFHDDVSQYSVKQMLSFLRFGLCIVSLVAVSGCVMNSGPVPPVPLTPEQIQQLVDSFEDSRVVQEQVASLTSPLLVANADLCEQGTVYGPGFDWITIYDLPLEVRGELGPALDIGETPSILYVEAGSPSARAGLHPGDLILEVNNVEIKKDLSQTTVESSRRSVRPYRTYLVQLLSQAGKDGTPLRLTVLRGELVRSIEFQPQESCNVQVVVTEDASKDLSSKGRTIFLSRGLYEFAQSDSELQALVAHELAHLIRRQGTRKATGTIAGGIAAGGAALGVIAPISILATVLSVLGGELDVGGGAIEASIVVLIASGVMGSRIGSRIATAGQHRQADYLSTYLLARAGVGPKEAMNIWKRLSKERDVAPSLRVSEARLNAIEDATKEVMAKHNANEPLVPNPKMKVSETGD